METLGRGMIHGTGKAACSHGTSLDPVPPSCARGFRFGCHISWSGHGGHMPGLEVAPSAGAQEGRCPGQPSNPYNTSEISFFAIFR